MAENNRAMTSPKSYLLRAFYEWILDNSMTPYVLVDASAQGVSVPAEYVEDGKIILNIAPAAVQTLVMDRDQLSFSARFRGSSREVLVPMIAVRAVYAKENGRGMVFPEEGGEEPTTPPSPAPKKPSLKVVK
ncbi:MAG: Stringent starvation protein B [Gammaproteobacteria bacterium]|nr:Stringent starvation protein B [Gammaproteobacteria bacterium]